MRTPFKLTLAVSLSLLASSALAAERNSAPPAQTGMSGAPATAVVASVAEASASRAPRPATLAQTLRTARESIAVMISGPVARTLVLVDEKTKLRVEAAKGQWTHDAIESEHMTRMKAAEYRTDNARAAYEGKHPFGTGLENDKIVFDNARIREQRELAGAVLDHKAARIPAARIDGEAEKLQIISKFVRKADGSPFGSAAVAQGRERAAEFDRATQNSSAAKAPAPASAQ